MVATLVRLRWRLTVNGLLRNVWAVIGTIVGVLYGLGGLAALTVLAVGLGQVSPEVIGAVLAGAGALVVAGWTLFPLLLTGADSTLDPRAIAAWTAPSPALTRGLAVAGAAGIPGILTGAGLLLPAVSWACAGQWTAAVLALALAPVALATCVLLSRVVVIGAGVSQSRRGREVAGLVGMLLLLGVALGPSFLQEVSLGAETGQALRTVGTVVGLTPLGWALAAPGYLAQGSVLAALGLTCLAVALPAALMPVWGRVVARAMTGPARNRTRSQSYEAAEAARKGARRRTAGVDPMVWQRRLARLVPSPAAAVAARCLRYWRSDPRYLSQVISLVLLPTVFAFVFARSAGSSAGQDASMTWGQAPVTVVGAALLLALFSGWVLNNDLATDSTAVWQLVSAGMRGRDDRLGRVVAAALWQVPLTFAVLVLTTAYAGRWETLPAVAGTGLALYGVGHAWSAVSSVVMPYETNAPGDSLWKSRGSGISMVIALVQAAGFAVIVAASAPAVGGLVWVAVSGAWEWGWLLLLVGTAWGLGAVWAGVVYGGRLLDRRGPQVLATIRSWPGHDETR
ncbi:transporter [Actinomyces faecalis]|uniref:transporter n=1 Tax=Actinomyces faecalis TaxID=2722820 RepID=UPI001557850C|nr:transporter [Actinomyces faecalis]